MEVDPRHGDGKRLNEHEITVEELWEHLFPEPGYLATLTGEQGDNPNELEKIDQKLWHYPEDLDKAAAYLTEHANEGRDAYFGGAPIPHRHQSQS